MDLDELISNTADGVCAITTEGKISLWNRFAEKILGYPAREVLGRPCCEVFVGRDAAGNRPCYRGCHVQTLIKRGGPGEKPVPAAIVGEPSSTPLTRREVEILRLMTGGANTKTMADRLHVSPATVRNHVQNIFGEIGVHSR